MLGRKRRRDGGRRRRGGGCNDSSSACDCTAKKFCRHEGVGGGGGGGLRIGWRGEPAIFYYKLQYFTSLTYCSPYFFSFHPPLLYTSYSQSRTQGREGKGRGEGGEVDGCTKGVEVLTAGRGMFIMVSCKDSGREEICLCPVG